MEVDSDQKVPVYGHGAKPNSPHYPSDEVEQCFPLSENEDSEVEGLIGVQTAYRESLSYLKMWGPTHFLPLIRHALEICKTKSKTQPYHYTILLMLTDGKVDDFDETSDVLADACNYPISVIIVGIGNDDFDKMTNFDNGKYRDKYKNFPVRDICKFVRFKYDFLTHSEQNFDEKEFRKLLFSEVPGQISEHFNQKQIPPKCLYSANADEGLSSSKSWLGKSPGSKVSDDLTTKSQHAGDSREYPNTSRVPTDTKKGNGSSDQPVQQIGGKILEHLAAPYSTVTRSDL